MTYDELTEEAKERAIEEMAEINVDYGWWSCLVEDVRQEWLEKYGIDFDPEGLCFDLSYRRQLYFSEGKIWVDDVDRLLSVLAPTIALELALGGEDNLFSFYFETYHYGGGDGNTGLYMEDCRDIESPDFPVDTEEWFRDLCRDFWYRLDKEYDYLTSREAIEETIRANEYDFTEDGEIERGEICES